MINFILKCLWYMLPAWVGNCTPIFAKHIFKEKFSTPIDLNKKFKGYALFGRTKTYRGFISGIIMAIFIVLLQNYLYQFNYIKTISLINYSKTNVFLFGFLMGFGALLGDLIKSFFKRRIGFNSGKSWFPFDQIDYLIGSLSFTSFIFLPTWDFLLGMIIIMVFFKIIADHIGYYLGICKKW